MAIFSTQRSGLYALAFSAFAALIIGCGGGGGGGGNNNNNNSNSSGNGDTGTPVTTSGAANSIGGGTDGGTGALQANSIYYITSNPTAGYDVKYTNVDGTVAGTYATGLSQSTPVAAPDPSSAGRLVFAAPASSGGTTFGIYRNTSASITGAAVIVSPRYSEIDSIQVSSDGTKVVFVAATAADATPHLYSVATTGSGSPTLLDGDDIISADLSSSDNIVVYEKLPATGSTELFVRDLNAATPVQFTNDAFDQDEPQFSKNGDRIVFSQDDGTGRHVLGILSAAGGAITTVDPFPGTTVSVRAPSFNSDGSRIAFVAEGDSTTNTGVFTCDVSGSNVVQVPNTAAPLPLRSLYWTNVGGRAAVGRSLHLNRPRPKK